jgi:hypothetical protein
MPAKVWLGARSELLLRARARARWWCGGGSGGLWDGFLPQQPLHDTEPHCFFTMHSTWRSPESKLAAGPNFSSLREIQSIGFHKWTDPKGRDHSCLHFVPKSKEALGREILPFG